MPADGDPQESDDGASTGLSFSVAVTIVTGPDAPLRETVVRRILSQASAPITVVSTAQTLSQNTASPATTHAAAAQQNGVSVPPDASATLNQDRPEDAQRNPAVSTSSGPTTPQASVDDVGLTDEPTELAPGTNHSADPSMLPDLATWVQTAENGTIVEDVRRIATERSCDCIIVDCPASVSPRELALQFQSEGGSTLRVDSIICAIDGARILADFDLQTTEQSEAGSESVTPAAAASENETEKPVESTGTAQAVVAERQAMLTAACIEDANMVIVTGGHAMKSVRAVISALNVSATVVVLEEREETPLALALNTNLYNPDTIGLNATWRRVALLSHSEDPKPMKSIPKHVKDVTFVYRARRPFHPTRFYDHVKDVATFTGVFRSTGRIWLPTRMNAPLEWEQAGNSATLRAGSPYWTTLPEDEWDVSDEQRETIKRNWDTQYGDRATEMVFVGVGFDKNRLQGLLDGCLLQDEEMVFNNLWENFSDPFEQWVPLEDDVEDPNSASTSALESDGADTPTAASDNRNSMASDSSGSVEGRIPDSDIPEAVLEKASALEVLESPSNADVENGRLNQSAVLEDYDEDGEVITSWDGSVADGILAQIPSVGLPVTLLTGFLGSGKTTVLNYILTANHGLKIAVLVNEFGEIDIDNQLVEAGQWSEKDDVLELSNGCICCSINDSFVAAVKKMLDRGSSIDYLVIETTGVADPVPVINSLMVSDIANDIRVDGILTVVDAENFDADERMGSKAALSQIMSADTILLSKTDIAAPERTAKVIDYIKKIRPAARILRSQRGRVPVAMILDVGLRIADSPARLVPERKTAHVHDDHDHEHDHEHGHEHDHGESGKSVSNESSHAHDHRHHHDHEHGPDCGTGCTDPTHDHSHAHENNHLEEDGFVSMSFRSDRAFVPELFMERFLQRLPAGVFRAKGLLSFHGFEQRYILNLSGRRYQFEEDNWPEGVAPGNQLVVIGKDLDIEDLRDMLEQCHWDATP